MSPAILRSFADISGPKVDLADDLRYSDWTSRTFDMVSPQIVSGANGGGAVDSSTAATISRAVFVV